MVNTALATTSTLVFQESGEAGPMIFDLQTWKCTTFGSQSLITPLANNHLVIRETHLDNIDKNPPFQTRKMENTPSQKTAKTNTPKLLAKGRGWNFELCNFDITEHRLLINYVQKRRGTRTFFFFFFFFLEHNLVYKTST